jgi:hypothetical protein
VEQQGATPPDELLEQVAKVFHVIDRPALRRSFLADPEGTLKQNGVDLGIFPEDLVDILADLSYEVLGIVARLNDFGCAHGLVMKTKGGVSVCFF